MMVPPQRPSLLAIAEAKSPSGSFTEGVYQLSVASASVLARLQILFQGLRRREELPVLGWVVHGYFWFLHVIYTSSMMDPL
jgi:hypothetical protein